MMPSGAKNRGEEEEEEEMGINQPPSPHPPTSTPQAQGSSGLESPEISGGRGEEEDVDVNNKDHSNGGRTTTSIHLEQQEHHPPPEVSISEVVALEQLGEGASAAPLTGEELELSQGATSVATDITLVMSQVAPPPAPAPAPAPAPLLEHRATWWNCCGLLDAFKGN
ncbi:uncharacterized protein M6B38_113350 [Iris pallida]|uniref:Uncharacterized protein n=1 Tax=Iris pallida TaxID=29817 RepID=A0AAX6IJY2_IRIPA|nr:uncharacterized protein M6B38_113350 [Iris pallida]